MTFPFRGHKSMTFTLNAGESYIIVDYFGPNKNQKCWIDSHRWPKCVQSGKKLISVLLHNAERYISELFGRESR